LKAASSEVATVATDLGRSIKDIHAQHLAAAEMAAREVRGAIGLYAVHMYIAACYTYFHVQVAQIAT
jgi:hypothetical protein